MIHEFNYNNIKYTLESQVRLLKYNKVLQICLHIINACNIILSVLSETIQNKIIYAVIVCTILNSVINYEILKAHSKIHNNTKVINDFMKYENNDNVFIPNEMILGQRCNNTPLNTPMIDV